MDFNQTENQILITQTIRDFAEKHIKPYMMEWDETQHFPVETLRALGELGLMGIVIPEEYGGSGFGYFEYITALTELGKVDGSLTLSVAAHNSLCTNHIFKFGNEAQRRKWIPKLASGEWIGSWGLTEPNTGSDAGRMQCVARQDGDDWIINGTKNFITHGISSNVTVVIARTGELLDSRGMTAFVVERGTQGFSGGKKENKLGMRCSETAEMIFDNCRIPKENVLGNVGDGFVQALKILDGGRISIAALSLGIATGAYEAAVQYSKEREQFGKSISTFQAIAFKLAEMHTKIEAAKLLTYQAADMYMRGENINKESAYAKYYASEVAVYASTEAVQIFGGYGYIKDFPVEKHYRDSKLCTIGEGTSEVQKLVISRAILK
ncbi:MAG TPA: acyl-CoA dehydrogenase family protein [Chitinophagales bacterium]|nr:acyl-CoA dehydrogenase family protein [Chitinophagales bacterium]MCB9075818.1 acyl-CoA dehydrogenase family protein [Chitinophagales bacterium]HMV03113.1 acyl-CoA dehydrogenase family protein [Chitinophagales bacterium]HMY42412.1 acyl-CoA dehydrogenase family protein [Chitinophagales bacterium]HMZ69137.1 acyl-CoA dehydrogenase family protein [Chitinophagales bacterium]